MLAQPDHATAARASTQQLVELLGREHRALADFLAALADFDRKQLWRDLGHASLFYFLHRELGLSLGAAHYRKVAAELVQRFPEVIEPLRDGRLCITSVVALAKVMTPENRREVLPRFFHLSKREAAAEAAALRPVEATPHRDVVTRVPSPNTRGTAATSPTAPRGAATRTAGVANAAPPDREAFHLDEVALPTSATSRALGGAGSAEVASAPAMRADSAEPLDASRSRLHVTVSRRFLEKLEEARDALSHARPGASAEEILEAGLDLLLADRHRRKGLVEKPRAEVRPSNSDHVPANVRREAWKRAGGRCEWPLDGGGTCGATYRLEFDHVVPRARGGPATTSNIRILCRPHNLLAAERVFGREHMDRFRRRAVPPPA